QKPAIPGKPWRKPDRCGGSSASKEPGTSNFRDQIVVADVIFVIMSVDDCPERFIPFSAQEDPSQRSPCPWKARVDHDPIAHNIRHRVIITACNPRQGTRQSVVDTDADHALNWLRNRCSERPEGRFATLFFERPPEY